MNKFAELAAKIRANQESMYAEADDLSTDADKTMSTFMAAAGKYRTMLDEAKAGVKAMEEAAAAMTGNGSPLPDSPPAVPPSPPVVPPPVEVLPPEPAPPVVEMQPVVPPPVPLDPTASGNPPA